MQGLRRWVPTSDGTLDGMALALRLWKKVVKDTKVPQRQQKATRLGWGQGRFFGGQTHGV